MHLYSSNSKRKKWNN